MKKRRMIFVLLVLCINIMAISMVADAAKKSLKTPVVTLSNVVSTGKIKVSWKKISGAKSYKVYRSSDNGKTWKLLSTTKNLSIINKNAVAGKTYSYKVKAIAEKTEQNSKYSKVKSCVCDLARPVITVSTELPTGKVKISWKKIDKAVKYEVYRSEDNGKNWSRIQKTKNTSMVNANVLTGKTYSYKVKAIASKTSANSAFSVKKKLECGYLKGEKKTVKYTKDDWTAVYVFPDSNTESVLLPYMTEVEVGETARVANTGTWTRVFYKGKLYYVWSVKGKNRFSDNKSDFVYETKTRFQQAVVDMAVDIALNWKTIYKNQQSQGIMNEDGTYGFDCSGFVKYIIEQVMQEKVPVYWITSNIPAMIKMDTIYNAGLEGEFKAKDIEMDAIEPGDVLFFYKENGEPNHCGIYLGDGEYAHASSYGGDDCVIITPIKENYEEKKLTIRRFLPEEAVPANKKMMVISGCKTYKKMQYESEEAYRLSKGEEVTVLYTAHLKEYDRGNWAYVENTKGEKAFVYLKNLDYYN